MPGTAKWLTATASPSTLPGTARRPIVFVMLVSVAVIALRFWGVGKKKKLSDKNENEYQKGQKTSKIRKK